MVSKFVKAYEIINDPAVLIIVQANSSQAFFDSQIYDKNLIVSYRIFV